MCAVGEHLGYLSKYAVGFMDSSDVQQACVVPHRYRRRKVLTGVYLLCIGPGTCLRRRT